jgi:hypothetical protein
MPNPRRPRDTNELAKSIVSIAIGEKENDSRPTADSATTLAQRRRAAKGGKARAANLEPKERRTIAKKAAAARWSSRTKSRGQSWNTGIMSGHREKPKLDAVLAGQPVGTWVVLDAGMSKILGAAETLEKAMQQAEITPGLTGGPDPKRPVILQIQDPTIACFY